MKWRVISLLMVVSVAAAGCGSYTEPSVVTQILSDPVYDGYISLASGTTTYIVTQGGTQSVLAGIDPGTNTEYRAFLDFPLSGYGGVPLDAVITSSGLDIVISSITTPSGSVPIQFDLVDTPLMLSGSEFSQILLPPLATVTTTIFNAGPVYVDVTPLMSEAQYLGLPDCQIRILQIPGSGTASPGLVLINDTTGTNRAQLAPLLQVTYY